MLSIYEVQPDDRVTELLICFSKDWEAEDSCRGYRANTPADILENRIFLAEEEGRVAGYLFGKVCRAEDMSSVMPQGTPYFEVEELYVVPERRSQGVGTALFRFAEEAVKPQAEYMVLSTATKNQQAILHFYIDELGMTFWSARLFKKIG